MLALAAVVASAGSPADANGTPRAERCARKGSVTVIRTLLVRVYRDQRSIEGALVYACHRPTGYATRLGSWLAQTLHQYAGPRATAIRGSLLAYGLVIDPEGDEGNPGVAGRPGRSYPPAG